MESWRTYNLYTIVILSCWLGVPCSGQSDLLGLPIEGEIEEPHTDWLLHSQGFEAQVLRTTDSNLVLTNGLIRREFGLDPNGATVAFDNLSSGAALLRAVRPEALLSIDGVDRAVGGLSGQPNQAFLLPQWRREMKADQQAFQFIGFRVRAPQPSMHWKRTRHHDRSLPWP
ncbi:MAG: hypothetical protein KTR24_11685, partial [Saprospiraceae bacterium]|nr:hypothetical protein [Saprospiraceae bacterium]